MHGVATPAKMTLFQFPKDPQRRLKWIENGKVPASCPNNSLYMCSLHFDKKFLCVNNRRTILIGNAIPNVCMEDDSEDGADKICENDLNIAEDGCEISESADLVLEVFPNEMDLVDEESEMNESERKFLISCNKGRESEMHYSESEELDSKVDSTIVNLNRKRKADSPMKKYVVKKCIGTSSSSAASTTSKTVCQTSVGNKNDNSNYNLECNEWDQVVDTTQVTTFIFKGEEYVQMPKDYYVNEKTDLLKKICTLESKLERIKESVNNILDMHD